MTVVCGLDFASTSQPKRVQKPQYRQPDRSLPKGSVKASERIPDGCVNG